MTSRSENDSSTEEAGTVWQCGEVEKILVEPYEYIAKVPGKDIRSQLIDAFNLWINTDAFTLQAVKDITKMLHNSSLLIDDIQDNSTLRRGIPVAHNVYGIATTINSANYMYFKCMERVIQLGNPDAAAAFTQQLLELHRGQGMDIHWRDTGLCPSEEQYKEMVLRKTGGLFGLAVKLMQVSSSDTKDYSKILELLGLHFQIRDDFANLVSTEYAVNKTFAEDLTEGKFSFPIIHAIKAFPDDHRVINILRQRSTDVTLKRFTVDVIIECGSMDYTKAVLVKLETEALEEIERLGGNPLLVKLFERLRGMYTDEEGAGTSVGGDAAAKTGAT